MAQLDCSKLASGLDAVVCGRPPIAGTNSRVILMNYADIDRSLSVVTNNVISELLLKDGAKGYEFNTVDNSTVGTPSLNKGAYFANFQHDLALRIFAKNEKAKKFVNNLNGARVVAIVENKEGGAGTTAEGEVKYEAYGWDAGLELNELTSTTEMADSVVYEMTMGSGETSKESSLPKSVYKTDLETTEQMLDSLVAA